MIAMGFKSHLKKIEVSDMEADEIFSSAQSYIPEICRSQNFCQIQSLFEVEDRKLVHDLEIAFTLLPIDNEAEKALALQTLKIYGKFLESDKYQELKTDNIDPIGRDKESEIENHTHTEGRESRKVVTYKGRNRTLRQLAIDEWGGYKCQICGMDFEETYGDIGHHFIEVHHIRMHSSFDGEHEVDPKEDLIPLCCNCHAMIHRGEDMRHPLSPKQLLEKYNSIKEKRFNND